MNFVPLEKWPGFNNDLYNIAGPCSAESREQVLETARLISENDSSVKIFRAGVWKPRTRPGTFEGRGEEALPWLQEVKEKYGFFTTCEVANAEHVGLALKYGVDILWIGARTTANPFSVQEIADRLRGIDIPVLVKNPISPDLALWMGSIERLYAVGITKIGAIHRGFASESKGQYRNRPLWRMPIELKRRHPDLPIICDPSHIGGKRDLIAKVCQKAIDVNLDGLMVETHINPNTALSDAAQQITPTRLGKIFKELDRKSTFSTDKEYEEHLDELRSEIDRIDQELIDALSHRMDVAKKIGDLKSKAHVTPLQMGRMEDLMNKRIKIAASLGLSEDYIRELYQIIHSESVKVQTEIIDQK
ncbi:MAG: chorismate mutase [Bacteriovoracaceae bacterium]